MCVSWPTCPHPLKQRLWLFELMILVNTNIWEGLASITRGSGSLADPSPVYWYFWRAAPCWGKPDCTEINGKTHRLRWRQDFTPCFCCSEMKATESLVNSIWRENPQQLFPGVFFLFSPVSIWSPLLPWKRVVVSPSHGLFWLLQQYEAPFIYNRSVREVGPIWCFQLAEHFLLL